MVLIHDGARPFVQQNTIHELVEKAASDKAASAGCSSKRHN